MGVVQAHIYSITNIRQHINSFIKVKLSVPSFLGCGASARSASCRVSWAGPGDGEIVHWVNLGDA